MKQTESKGDRQYRRVIDSMETRPRVSELHIHYRRETDGIETRNTVLNGDIQYQSLTVSIERDRQYLREAGNVKGKQTTSTETYRIGVRQTVSSATDCIEGRKMVSK